MQYRPRKTFGFPRSEDKYLLNLTFKCTCFIKKKKSTWTLKQSNLEMPLDNSALTEKNKQKKKTHSSIFKCGEAGLGLKQSPNRAVTVRVVRVQTDCPWHQVLFTMSPSQSETNPPLSVLFWIIIVHALNVQYWQWYYIWELYWLSGDTIVWGTVWKVCKYIQCLYCSYC